MKLAVSKILPNPENPRIIKDYKFDKLVRSIKDFPEMLKLRPIIINKDNVVLGGNMRLKAAIKAGIKEVEVKVADLSSEKEKEFVIKDNSNFGEWDWDILANEWDAEELKQWGLDIPKWEDTSFDSKVEDTGEYDYPDENIQGSHVKMVQLFLNTETEPNFRKWELYLRKKFSTDNLTDTIYKVVEELYKQYNNDNSTQS